MSLSFSSPLITIFIIVTITYNSSFIEVIKISNNESLRLFRKVEDKKIYYFEKISQISTKTLI